ncbi:MAG: ATP-binding protein, partial [Candidatus Binatia bacterium]
MSEHQKKTRIVDAADWLVGGGEMGDLIRSMDWSKTPLGPIESWPHSLRTTLSICLASRFPMAVWWGPEITQLYNDGYRPFLGIKHPCSMGQPGDECWAEIWDVCGPLYRKVMETGESTWSADLQLLMERNRYLEETYFTFAYSPIRDEEGAIRGNLITVTETTERVLGERRLRTLRDLGGRASQARSAEGACELAAQILQTNTADIPFALVYLLDPERTAAHLVSVSNLDRQSAAAPHKIDFSEQRREEVWPLDAVARTQQPELVINLEQRLAQLPGGSWPESPSSALALPLIAPGQQQVTGFLVAGVNPRRILDDQYRDFFNLVAGHVGTAVANARAYEEERKRAEALAEIDRAKTAFFSNVSHEFRTPLTLMLGPVEETLADPDTPSAVRARLEVSHRNSLRLLKLVNSLLDFSRIEAGRIQASYEPTDLPTLTAELASVFRSAIERAGMKLTVDCQRISEPVYVDREMWEKVVLNLLSNAFKYTLAGEIEVSLRVPHWDSPPFGKGTVSFVPHLEEESRGEGFIELSVRDTGIGIPEYELPKIFQRFYRIEGARGRTHEGSGIGLSLVQELVKLHGGTISVDSVHSQGTTFTVRIPRGSGHLPADRIRATAPRTLESTRISAGAYVEEALRWLSGDTGQNEEPLFAASTTTLDPLTQATQGARVIVADDNADMRDYVRRLLAQHYRIEPVANGEAALAAARRERPDLILADVMMPVMDGFELLRATREDQTLKTVPVIMLSARAGEEARVEGLGAGADDYLVKPFSARELLARVGAQVSMSRFRSQVLRTERTLRAEAETLNEVASSLTVELDLQKLVQKVTDAGTELTAAKFGAFFYNYVNEQGESYLLYTLSGAPREAFEKFGAPRNTPLFGPTFRGAEAVRIDDVRKDPRYGQNPPHHGMPEGHLPVRSYLAVPVISRSGQVLGGLFFGHPEPCVFTEHAERIAVGIAAQAAIALDNAQLYGQAEKEIAERMRAEEDLQKLNAELENRVIGRTAELLASIAQREKLQEQLLQAQKMESIGTLAGGIAHDFNNLLNIIMGYTLLIQHNAHQGKLSEALDVIKETVQRAAALVQQLLAISRKTEISFQEIDINAILQKLKVLLSETFPKTIETALELDPDIPPLMADPNHIHQALLNLCVNARDAMPAGGKLLLETSIVNGVELPRHFEDVKEERYVCIRVTDTGTGIDEVTKTHVFEPFFTTKPQGQGTGLGLSVVYGIATNHAGFVDVESEPGRGTIFSVYLPLIQEKSAIVEIKQQLENDRGNGGGGETVLFVDDEEKQLRLMREFLESEGYRVLVAKDGAEAVEMHRLHKKEIAVVVLDLGLPKLNGWEAFQRMRKTQPNLNALFATGFLSPEIEAEMRRGRLGGVINKPYRLNEVLEKISAAIR